MSKPKKRSRYSETDEAFKREFKEKMYFELRHEINDKLKRIESLSNFCFTGIIAFFTLALKTEINNLFLLSPIVLILLTSYRSAINRIDIATISAYIQVKELEPKSLSWEKDNTNFMSNLKIKDCGIFYKVASIFKFWDFIIMIIICVYIYANVADDNTNSFPIGCILCFISGLIEIYLTLNLNLRFDKINPIKLNDKIKEKLFTESDQ